MLNIGDIVIVPTTPPHIASVTSGDEVICEDGTVLPIDSAMERVATAHEIVQAMVEGVLQQNASR